MVFDVFLVIGFGWVKGGKWYHLGDDLLGIFMGGD
jgi:hypothetical protein